VCRLNNKYTVNICLGLPADKDRIKLCATWIDVEINLTLVSHWFYFSVSLYLSRKDEENVAFLSLIFLINYDISSAFKEWIFKTSYFNQTISWWSNFLTDMPKTLSVAWTFGTITFFPLCTFQLQEYVLQLNHHSSLCKAHS
jgi:hypothetical protein